MDIVERIEQLIEQTDKPTYKVLVEIGLPHSALFAWKKGNANPSVQAIIKIAKYFNVTSDYLLGLEPPKQKTIPKEIKYMWNIWEKCDVNQKIQVISIFRTFEDLFENKKNFEIRGLSFQQEKNGEMEDCHSFGVEMPVHMSEFLNEKKKELGHDKFIDFLNYEIMLPVLQKLETGEYIVNPVTKEIEKCSKDKGNKNA